MKWNRFIEGTYHKVYFLGLYYMIAIWEYLQKIWLNHP